MFLPVILIFIAVCDNYDTEDNLVIENRKELEACVLAALEEFGVPHTRSSVADPPGGYKSDGQTMVMPITLDDFIAWFSNQHPEIEAIHQAASTRYLGALQQQKLTLDFWQVVMSSEGSEPSGVSVVTNRRDPDDDSKFLGIDQSRCKVLKNGRAVHQTSDYRSGF